MTPRPNREDSTRVRVLEQLDVIESQADAMARFSVNRDDATLAKTFRTAARRARRALLDPASNQEGDRE